VKTPRRKPPKRKPAKRIDHELIELASVLDEHQLDNNARGWFIVPWRDGWNAMQLGLACFNSLLDEYNSFRENEIHKYLERLQRDDIKNGATVYFETGLFLERIDTENVSSFLYAALRCLQVLIANSSGGGVVYNEILRNAFSKTEPDHLFEELVLEHRCRDALGTTAVIQQDEYDPARRAFAIAWRRGLYHAAYSIKPTRRS
jgi:hypothetical protein